VKDSLDLGEQRDREPLPAVGEPGPFLRVDTSVAYASVDGPRTDVHDTTSFWLDRYGQRVAFATLWATPRCSSGRMWLGRAGYEDRRSQRAITGAVYDDHGNVTAITDSSTFQNGRYATTRYVWNRTWDFDSIAAPLRGTAP